jgi:hypothetical protein
MQQRAQDQAGRRAQVDAVGHGPENRVQIPDIPVHRGPARPPARTCSMPPGTFTSGISLGLRVGAVVLLLATVIVARQYPRNGREPE